MKPSLAHTLAGIVLALLCALQALALLRMPAAWQPAAIEVTLARGAAIELDGAALAAPRAPARALRLRRDDAGRWWAASPDGLLPLRFEHGERRLRGGTLALAPGLAFQLGAGRYTVSAAGPGELQMDDGTHAWRYTPAGLWRDGTPLPPCPGAGPGAHALAAWNRWAPTMLAAPRPLAFGGSLSCGTRIGDAWLAPGSATIVFDDGVPLLLAGYGGARATLLVDAGTELHDLATRDTLLGGVGALTVGRTRLLVDDDGGTLRLRPTGRVALYRAPDIDLPAALRWRWQQRDPWAVPAASLPWMAGALGVAALSALAARQARRDSAPALRVGGGALLAMLGLGLLLAARGGVAPGAAWSLLAACCALAYGWRLGGGVLAAALPLLAAGLLLQLELGAGAPDSAWLRHFQKTAAAMSFGLGLLGCWKAWPARQRLAPGRVEAALLAMAASAVAALLVQVGWGDETGVFDLQPVEFAKLALVLLSAHCMALGLDERARGSRGAVLRWLRLVTPALLFAVLLGVALVQVDDYSPLILLLVWGAAMLLAWACAARRRAAMLALLAAAGLGVLALVVLRGASPLEAAQWQFYGERFGAWLAPTAHPHTGAQLLLGAQAIGAGGWVGEDGAFGLATLGQGAGSALAIPAVQDDFAPAFLLQRHGLIAALALWTLQALFLAALLGAAARAWQGAARARHYHGAWLGRWRCFALCGGAGIVFGHLLLSWGTNLAFFPVMGQPMSFLSAGGSHLLFFIFPLLAVGAGEPSNEEN